MLLRVWGFLFVFLTCLPAEPLVSAAIRGRVLDPSQSPVAGARVIVRQGHDSAGFSAVSTQTGEFAFLVPPGTYRLVVSADGFVDFSKEAVAAATGGEPLDIVLQIQDVRTTVTVTETVGYQLVTTSTATKTPTALVDIPQSIKVVSVELIRDQLMIGMEDVVR
jgi:hypothetical protein